MFQKLVCGCGHLVKDHAKHGSCEVDECACYLPWTPTPYDPRYREWKLAEKRAHNQQLFGKALL